MASARANRKHQPSQNPLPSTGESRACAQVAELFGMDWSAMPHQPPSVPEEILNRLTPKPGTITLLTGASGSGKSSLLRQMRNRFRSDHRWIDLNRVRPHNRAVIDCFGRAEICQVFSRLSRAGLSEASCYARRPSELSEGQRWRLKLALALNRAKNLSAGRSDTQLCAVLVCDEFAALLDRVTACVVARSLRRCIDRSRGLSAIVATSHDDLVRALKPNFVVRCEFGKITFRAL